MPQKVRDRPQGTRCYVPGYLNDADQFRVDGIGIAPLAVAAIAKRVLRISFKKPSGKRAAAVIGGVINSALGGNLTAVKCLWERRNIAGIAKERAVWASGLNKVTSQKPELITLMTRYFSLIPAIDHSSPESAARTAIERVYTGPQPGSMLPGQPGPISVITPVGPSVPTPGAPGTISILPPYTPPWFGPPTTGPAPVGPPVPGYPEIPAEPTVPPVAQAGMFGGFDMGKMLIPGLVLLGISMLSGKRR